MQDKQPKQEEWSWSEFKGFTSPNTTQIPDDFFDFICPRLNGSEVKVMNYLMRRTYGFKKDSDTVSISQMLNGIVKRNGERLDFGTGLTKKSILKALNSLEDKNLIIRRRQFDFNGGYMATNYEVNRCQGTLGGKNTLGVDTLGGKSIQGGVGGKNTQPMVQNSPKPLGEKVPIQHTVNNTQLDNNVNVNVNDSHKKKKKKSLKDLDDLGLDQEHAALIAQDIVDQLGDDHSHRFYMLVACKVPETIIRKTLSEVKGGGAKNPARVFTSQMQAYAREQFKQQSIDSSTDARDDLVKKLSAGRK